MKLSAAQLTKVEDQLGVEALPEDNPAMPKLKEVFGEHTFFVDAAGLNVVEPIADSGTDGTVVKIASWTDDKTQLRVHEPEPLSVAVEMGPGEADEAG
jgi:hypothetical protein